MKSFLLIFAILSSSFAIADEQSLPFDILRSKERVKYEQLGQRAEIYWRPYDYFVRITPDIFKNSVSQRYGLMRLIQRYSSQRYASEYTLNLHDVEEIMKYFNNISLYQFPTYELEIFLSDRFSKFSFKNIFGVKKEVPLKISENFIEGYFALILFDQEHGTHFAFDAFLTYLKHSQKPIIATHDIESDPILADAILNLDEVSGTPEFEKFIQILSDTSPETFDVLLKSGRNILHPSSSATQIMESILDNYKQKKQIISPELVARFLNRSENYHKKLIETENDPMLKSSKLHELTELLTIGVGYFHVIGQDLLSRRFSKEVGNFERERAQLNPIIHNQNIENELKKEALLFDSKVAYEIGISSPSFFLSYQGVGITVSKKQIQHIEQAGNVYSFNKRKLEQLYTIEVQNGENSPPPDRSTIALAIQSLLKHNARGVFIENAMDVPWEFLSKEYTTTHFGKNIIIRLNPNAKACSSLF